MLKSCGGPLHSDNLVPFKQRRDAYHLPGGKQDGSAYAMERLDPGLSVEEQSYVRRYLAYADTFLKNAKKELPSIKGGATRLRAEQRKNGKEAA